MGEGGGQGMQKGSIYVCVYECFCKKEAMFGCRVAGGKGARYKEEGDS